MNLQVTLVRATEAYRCPQDNNILIGTCLLNERTALICSFVDQLNERLSKWSQLDFRDACAVLQVVSIILSDFHETVALPLSIQIATVMCWVLNQSINSIMKKNTGYK